MAQVSQQGRTRTAGHMECTRNHDIIKREIEAYLVLDVFADPFLDGLRPCQLLDGPLNFADNSQLGGRQMAGTDNACSSNRGIRTEERRG